MRVLGLQASHLLLIRTNLGYGTVLTAACTPQGCSACGLVFSAYLNVIFIFSPIVFLGTQKSLLYLFLQDVHMPISKNYLHSYMMKLTLMHSALD
jgi:hypothetical protein